MTLISVSTKNLGYLDCDLQSLRAGGWVRRLRRGKVGKQKIVDEGPRYVLGSPKLRDGHALLHTTRESFRF
jgi:hypothetical protein